MAFSPCSLLCYAVLFFSLVFFTTAAPTSKTVITSTAVKKKMIDVISSPMRDDDGDDDGDDDDDDGRRSKKRRNNDNDDDDDDSKGRRKSGDRGGAAVDPVNTRSDDLCFSGSATVLLDNGVRKTMSELAVGDRVQVGPNQFSEVFMFTHKMSDVKHHFITLRTTAGPSISLTARHYIHSNGALVAAANVKVGDTVELGDGSVSRVAEITTARKTGLYNPQTVHGDIVVDGVRTSTYTASVHPKAAHALLAPLRALFRRVVIASKAGEHGGSSLAQYFPKGGSCEAL